MNKNSTPFLSDSLVAPGHDADKPSQPLLQPSTRVIDYLRLLARNYRVDPRLPSGYQGMMLG
ncbi:MAG: hypothetical protein LBM06_05485 [Prevotellaceae bacterium]|jgi:hypothetical protein|nr:hypothetical protein [Prevotellaceae bacterium]